MARFAEEEEEDAAAAAEDDEEWDGLAADICMREERLFLDETRRNHGGRRDHSMGCLLCCAPCEPIFFKAEANGERAARKSSVKMKRRKQRSIQDAKRGGGAAVATA